MKKRTFYLLVAAIILAGVLFNSIYYVNNSGSGLVYSRTYLMNLTVEESNVVGFDVSSDALTFGAVPRGGFARRHVIVDNNESYEMLVLIYSQGEMADWVFSSQNEFIIRPYQSIEVNISAYPPENADIRTYTGNITFTFYKV